MTAYQKVWPEGWKDNEDGGTYIDAAGLNHMEDGIAAATNAVTAAETRIQELNTQDATVLRNAKQYSDGNLATAKSYTDTADSNIRSLIAERLSTTYKAGGSVAFSALPALTAENLGVVVNVNEAFTTNANFVEGAGKNHPAGTNVVVALSGSTYKYDALAGFVDLSAYATTSTVNSQLNGKADKSTMTAALANKVDAVSGKGLSTNDFTTAEKDKLLSVEAGAQVNEITAEHYRSVMAMLNLARFQNAGFQKQFENFRAVFDNFLYVQGVPLYMDAVGVGVIDIRDAAAGQIHSITVDSSLSGQRLYVQLSNEAGLTDTTVTVNSDGVALLSLATRKGRNRLYVTTSAYTFPPGTNGGHGAHTGGTYVNSHTDENGKFAYDYWLPKNAVDAKVRYIQDIKLGDEVAKELSYDDFLAMLGLSVTYSVTDNPAAVHAAGKELYVKLDGYPFATKEKPTYSKCNYPCDAYKVFYVAEYHYFMA